jgi:hypothetical protein
LPKAKSIYIFGAEPQSGKSVVLLGTMERLSRHVQYIEAISKKSFRPISALSPRIKSSTYLSMPAG